MHTIADRAKDNYSSAAANRFTGRQRDRASHLTVQNAAGRPASKPMVQMRRIPDLDTLKTGIRQSLDAGEATAGSNDRLLSSRSSNVNKISFIYTPGTSGKVSIQKGLLADAVGNAWRENWYDRVDQRVEQGAEDTFRDALFWANDIRSDHNYEDVTPYSIELLGEELHDRGLGPAKIYFLIEDIQTLPSFMVAVIKPEDRSIEEAIIGSGDSVATRLNKEVSVGRRVNTLNMSTDPTHGTIVEHVGFSIKGAAEFTLRKLRFWDPSETVSVETIGLAFLTGLYDLHHKNVMTHGGAPVLIDADVAARPWEFSEGPSVQAGFKKPETRKVIDQIGGDRSGASKILQYAIDNPVRVTEMIKTLIGDHRARIVPVFTRNLELGIVIFGESMEKDDQDGADEEVRELANGVEKGLDGSPGLQGELGGDQGNNWDVDYVVQCITNDFDRGVVPHFQYQPSTGEAFLHGRVIWKGITLEQSMEMLARRLRDARD
jgi:hypothetical protein